METSATEQFNARQFCSECGRPFATDDLARFGSAAVCAECKPNYVQRMREGVGVSTQYGGFWRRAVALWIDNVLITLVSYPIGMIMAVPTVSGFGGDLFFVFSRAFISAFWGWGAAITFALEIAYNVYFVSQKGATLGKMVMGLKIVTATGGPISVGRALARYFSRILSYLIFCIGYIMAAFDDQKRALHDHICNTRVIRD